MAIDWLGSGAKSAREFAEAIVRETIRRVKIELKNDHTVVPTVDDTSVILAARGFAVPLPPPSRPPDASVDVLAARSFSGRVSGTPGRKLSFGAHLTGGSYDGSADVSLATDALPTNVVSTLVVRDANGDFAARFITGTHFIGPADTLFTPRTINGVAFDGSANITITAAGATLTFGTHLTGTSYNGSAPVTIATDAAVGNVANAIVARDGSGNFSAGTITAALTGNASTATALAAPTTGFVAQTATPSKADLGSLPTLGQLASWAAAIDAALKAHGITST